LVDSFLSGNSCRLNYIFSEKINLKNKQMPRTNSNIILWMGTGNRQDKPQRFPAFNGQSKEKSIQGFQKRLIWPNRYKFPIAHIYVDNVLVKKYLQGHEVSLDANDKNWYGADISAYKVKLILSGSNNFVGPYYSNSYLSKKDQLKGLLEQYCKGIYKGKFISALIYTCQSEEKVVQILYKNKEYIIYDAENKAVKNIDAIYEKINETP
jgi:hypothetical protein